MTATAAWEVDRRVGQPDGKGTVAWRENQNKMVLYAISDNEEGPEVSAGNPAQHACGCLEGWSRWQGACRDQHVEEHRKGSRKGLEMWYQ